MVRDRAKAESLAQTRWSGGRGYSDTQIPAEREVDRRREVWEWEG